MARLIHEQSLIQHVVFITAYSSLGLEQELKKQLLDYLSYYPLSLCEEMLVQSALFAGVPRALNAFRILSDAIDELDDQRVQELESEASQWREHFIDNRSDKGFETFERVYGDRHRELFETLKSRHHMFAHWIIQSAYGEILSRHVLPLELREIAAVTALSVLNMPLQLWGHLQGAIRNGVAVDTLQEISQWLTPYCHDEMILKNMLTKVK